MKKFLIMPVLLLLVSGASPSRVEPLKEMGPIYQSPINTKLDSINIKAAELRDLIKQL